jgi:alpha-glucosidase
LDFLNPDTTYLANIYTDDSSIDTATKVRCTYLLVSSKQTLKLNLKATGGAAIRFVPISKSEAKKYKKYNGLAL